MEKSKFNFKTLYLNLIITIILFSTFSGSSDISCSGEHYGKAFGNFVLWNMPDPSTSLSTIVDLKYFMIDFSLSFFIILIIIYFILTIFQIINPIITKTKWLIVLSVFSIIIAGFFSLDFLLGINLTEIDCNRINNTFNFGMRIGG